MEAENSETLTVEAIEWPFLKSQRDHEHDVSSPDGSADHYEIVVSNVDDGTDGLHHFSTSSGNDDTPGSDSNFETCLISNADLAALTSTPPSSSDGIKMESLKDHQHHHHHQNERVEYDAVQYFSDAGLGPGDDVVMTDDQQKLIKVYQTAMENSDNKLITVYEIKPEVDEDGNSLGGGRDVLVEIVSSPEDHLLRGTATLSADGTLMIGSPDGNDLHTHLTIPASMAAAMGLTTTSMSQAGEHYSSLSPPQQSSNTTTTTTTVAELRCTLCGFVSFSRDEIGAHCEDAHDLFLCQACNLVFKRRQSLQSHARAKHGTTFVSQRSKNMGVNNRGGRVSKKVAATASNINNSQTTKFFNPLMTSPVKNNAGRQQQQQQLQQQQHHQQQQQQQQMQSTLSQDIMLQLPTQPLQPSLLNRSGHLISTSTERNNFELMPDIREILAKNKAVMPNLTSAATTVTFTGTTSMAASRQKKTTKGKRQQNHNWARTLSQGDQPLILDSRLSDPVTRNQFNSEFAKKITSHGIGAEMFGMSQDRLPSLRGTYRLDIKERVAENGDASGHGASPSGATSNGGETMYSYDIVDIGIPSEGCKVICGLCNFSNPRIENVLFHCEIDHKQYYCQNKRCQYGFSSWDTLMRHMKNVHRKEKQ